MPIVLVTNRTYCYAELAISSLAIAVTIANTHFPTDGEMARLSWSGWLGQTRKCYTCKWSPSSTLSNFADPTNDVTARHKDSSTTPQTHLLDMSFIMLSNQMAQKYISGESLVKFCEQMPKISC